MHGVIALRHIRIDPPLGLMAMNKNCYAVINRLYWNWEVDQIMRNSAVTADISRRETWFRPMWLTQFWVCHFGKNVRRLCAKPWIGPLCMLLCILKARGCPENADAVTFKTQIKMSFGTTPVAGRVKQSFSPLRNFLLKQIMSIFVDLIFFQHRWTRLNFSGIYWCKSFAAKGMSPESDWPWRQSWQADWSLCQYALCYVESSGVRRLHPDIAPY